MHKTSLFLLAVGCIFAIYNLWIFPSSIPNSWAFIGYQNLCLLSFIGFIILVILVQKYFKLKQRFLELEETHQRQLSQCSELIEKQASDILKQQNLFYQLLDHAPYAVVCKNSSDNYRYVFANKKAEALFEISRDKILNKTDFELFEITQATERHSIDEKVIANGQTLEIHAEQLSFGENHIFAHTVKVPLYYPVINSTLLFIFIEDITERVQAEQETYRLLTILENSPDLICMMDLHLKIFYLNPASLKLLGLKRVGDALHESFINYLKEIDKITFEEIVLPVVLSNGEWRGELCLYNHTLDKFIDVDISAFLTIDHDGQPNSISCIVRDITQSKQAAAELMKAKQSAEVANKAKSIFLANMSHELRTPLNAVLGFAQILQRDISLTPKQRNAINTIQRSGDYLLTLITDVLDLAKVEANRLELMPTSILLNEFLHSILDLTQIRAEQKDIYFIYEQLTDLPTSLLIDEKRLRQVLLNLLGNAIKFTQTGGVTFKVGCEFLSNTTTLLRFQIEDTGIGIAEEDIPKLFKPFQQVGDKRYRAEGTGLGLSISKSLVELMGGHLKVNSELNKGSCFWFALPLPIIAPPVSQKIDSLEHAIVGYTGARKKILLVDDYKENLELFSEWLKDLGFDIFLANNGQEGLTLASSIHIDGVITDLMMPKMTGLEMTRQLRQMLHYQDLPIIAVSASVFEVNQQQSIQAGCSAFLAKPIHLNDLLILLQKFLKIDWIYQDNQVQKIPTNISISSLAKTINLEIVFKDFFSSEQIHKLYEACKMGDIEEIKLQIKNSQLTEDNPAYQLIDNFLQNFELEPIENVLTDLITRKTTH